VGIAVGAVAGFVLVGIGIDPADLKTQIGLNILGVLINIFYFAAGHSSAQQATFGKKTLGLKVTDTAGYPLTFGRAVAREVLKQVLILLCLINIFASFFTIVFTEKKQALHDMIVGTVVVRR
jgi:uncharacterized RDD family membrane protein YckC